MPKIRTHKATDKRIKRTKKGSFLTRKVGQDHFNARQSSCKTMNKRRDKKVAKQSLKAIKKVLPYHRKKSYAN